MLGTGCGPNHQRERFHQHRRATLWWQCWVLRKSNFGELWDLRKTGTIRLVWVYDSSCIFHSCTICLFFVAVLPDPDFSLIFGKMNSSLELRGAEVKHGNRTSCYFVVYWFYLPPNIQSAPRSITSFVGNPYKPSCLHPCILYLIWMAG